MREILFRGKRTDNNEWVYGSLVVMDDECKYGNSDAFSNLHILEKKEIEIRAFSSGCGTWVNNELIQVHKNTVGQLLHKEKNGRQWFKGDIAKIDIYVRPYNDESEWFQGNDGFEGTAIGEVDFCIRKGLCIKNYKIINLDTDEEIIYENSKKTITLGRSVIVGNIHDK